jgi:hypothetical protein
MPAPRSTGLSGVDAQHDFLRARRTATVAKLVARDRTETEAYMHIAAERYRLLRTHNWSDKVLRQVVEGRKRKRR